MELIELLKISPEDLSDQEKDDLFSTIVWFDLDYGIDVDLNQVKHIFKISQELLKYKGQQVDSLISELDDLAAKQGEEEAKKFKDRISYRNEDEIEEIKDENLALKRKNTELERERNKLNLEVEHLQHEKYEMQNEIFRLRDRDDDSSSTKSSTYGVDERTSEFQKALQQKNKHISQLLEDIEAMEKENSELNQKLRKIRDELIEATTQMAQTTEQLNVYKKKNQQFTERSEIYEEKIQSLQSQIDELIAQKTDRDKQIDEFSVALDKRIDEWKSILDKKNEEITTWKIRYEELSSSYHPNENMNANKIENLLKAIDERDEKIENLQVQLEDATKEMNSTIRLIETLRHEQDTKNNNDIDESVSTKIINELKKKLHETEVSNMEIKKLLITAEEDSAAKGQEVIELISYVKKYEHGEFGLAEAVATINEMSKKLSVRDKQIVELVQSLNHLKSEAELLEEENLTLTEKLGLTESPRSVRPNGIAFRQKQQRKLISQLQGQIESLEDEKLQMKVEIRQLRSHKMSPRSPEKKTEPEKTTDSCHQDQAEELIVENEALRKGLHEVLTSIREQNGQSQIEIKSQILDRLLKALDIRYVSGWYNPAMRLQAEIHSLEAQNMELRDQLRTNKSTISSRKPSREFSKSDVEPLPKLDICDGNLSSIELVSKMQVHLMHVLNEYHMEKENVKNLQEKLENYRREMNITRHQIGLLYSNYKRDKTEFQMKCSDYEKMQHDLSVKNESLEAQINVLSKSDQSDLEKLKDLTNEVVVLRRKYSYLLEVEDQLRKDLEYHDEEKRSGEIFIREKINDFKFRINQLNLENKFLKNAMIECVPVHKFKTLEKQFESLRFKHRMLIETKTETSQIEKLNREIEILQSEKKIFTEQLCSTSPQTSQYFQQLYNLSQEQLQKSEQRHSEIESQNNQLKIKNIELQSQILELHDKIAECSFPVSGNVNNMAQELEMAHLEIESLKQNVDILKHGKEEGRITPYSNLVENTRLKHLIVDLQAETDDKMTIARMASEIESLRKINGHVESKWKMDQIEIKHLKEHLNRVQQEKESLDLENKKSFMDLNNKCRIFQRIISYLRQQYAGSCSFSTTERHIENIKSIHEEKQIIWDKLNAIKSVENGLTILKDEYNEKIKMIEELFENLKISDDQGPKIIQWQRDRSEIIVKELKCRKMFEHKNQELQEALKKIQKQELDILKLEEEIIQQGANLLSENPMKSESKTEHFEMVSIAAQTDGIIKINKNINTDHIDDQTKLCGQENQQRKISDLENQIQKLRLELEEKSGKNNGVSIGVGTDLLGTVKVSHQNDEKIVKLEELIKEKDATISRCETQLQETQIRMHEQVEKLQNTLLEQQKLQIQTMQDANNKSVETVQVPKVIPMPEISKPISPPPVHSEPISKALDVIDNDEKSILSNVQKIQELEGHTAELHTALRVLDSQLSSCRQEAARWRTLADDRLQAMDQLKTSLEEHHKSELMAYKKEWERWRLEAETIKSELMKRRINHIEHDKEETSKEIESNLLQLNEKDQELIEFKNQIQKLGQQNDEKHDRIISLETSLTQARIDIDKLKKQLAVSKNKEKLSREEIRALRERLNRPLKFSARSDRVSSSCIRYSLREQKLQKKISELETELSETKTKLDREIALNESRRAKNTQEIALWDKQKRWQQMAEKFRDKLKIKSDEAEKLQQNYVTSRGIITRLEREKNILETKLRMSRENSTQASQASFLDSNRQVESLLSENARLHMDLESLQVKLEMVDHSVHLREKLEAQERKIAVLELASHSSNAALEIERLHNTICVLEKQNMRLEAANLELKLDVEKMGTETPRLRDQLEHLQRYVDVLKAEQRAHEHCSLSNNSNGSGPNSKKYVEMEKTLFILKRVVEKLQAENKRLLSSKPCTTIVADKKEQEKLKAELSRTREQYKMSLDKINQLEKDLTEAKKHIAILENSNCVPEKLDGRDSAEINELKVQLTQKNELLEKVKILLHKAAAKERALDEQVKTLKKLIPPESTPSSSST